jgi:hypothetical protein
MDDFRAAVSMSVLPLALVAAGMFAAAFAIGDRARVLRRLGAWAVAAGLTWVVLPPLAVWAARRWAPGADAVIAAAIDEATSGLLPVALALVGGGVTAFAISFAVAPAREPEQRRVSPARPRATRPSPPRRQVSPAPVPAVTRQVPRARPVEPTAEMPAVDRPASPNPVVEPTAGSDPDRASDADGDALWDYYSS